MPKINPAEHARDRVKAKMAELAAEFAAGGPSSRERFEAAAGELLAWRKAQGLSGLWEPAPLMVTATLDDAMGQGLSLIHRFAEAAGLRCHPLGLRVPVEKIVAACRERQPAFLGLTVLWLDAEDALAALCRRLPPETVCVAGGPAFRADPDLAASAGVHHVARDAAAFWEILLGYA